MRSLQFKRQLRGGPGIRPELIIYLIISFALAFASFRSVFNDINVPVEMILVGVFFLALGVAGLIVLGIHIAWRIRPPVCLIFDENGFGGSRTKRFTRKSRIEWNQVASAKLREWENQKGQTVQAEIEVGLLSGKQFKLDVHHLDQMPAAVFHQFDGFWSQFRSPVALSQTTERAPVDRQTSKSLRRFRVTTAREDGSGVEVREVESSTEEDAMAFAVLSGLTVVAVEELPQSPPA